MLGYDVDFGHMEALSLISAPKYPEKQVKLQFIVVYYVVLPYSSMIHPSLGCSYYMVRSIQLHTSYVDPPSLITSYA